MQKPITLFLFIIVALFSCSRINESKRLVFFNDLEAIYGWNKDTRIEKRASHSGRFAAFADSSQVYNFGFRLPVKDLGPEKIYHVHAKVWAFCSSLSNSSYLVINLVRNGQSLMYESVRIESSTSKTGIWFGVQASMKMDENLMPDDELVVYVMNEGKERVWFDDMEIEVVKTK